MAEFHSLISERKETQKALNRAKARLEELELELASFGRLFAPDELLTEHETTRTQINKLEIQLEQL
jgi:hypothetical protein